MADSFGIKVGKYHNSSQPWLKSWYMYCPNCTNHIWSVFNLVEPGTRVWFETWDKAYKNAYAHNRSHRRSGKVNPGHWTLNPMPIVYIEGYRFNS